MAKVLKDLERTLPTSENGRVRNYLASKKLGSEASTIHENIVNPGSVVPWHSHPTEEVIVILKGRARCQTQSGTHIYEPGDVVIFPAFEEHTIENAGDTPIVQLCFFPSSEVTTKWREKEVNDGQSLALANADSGADKK